MRARRATFLPPSIMHDVDLDRVIVGDGCGALLLLWCCRAGAVALVLSKQSNRKATMLLLLRFPLVLARAGLPAAAAGGACAATSAPNPSGTARHPPTLTRRPAAVLNGCKISNSVLGQSM